MQCQINRQGVSVCRVNAQLDTVIPFVVKLLLACTLNMQLAGSALPDVIQAFDLMRMLSFR